MKLVEDTLASVTQVIEDKRLEHLRTGEEQGLCMDAGYDYDEVREIAWEFGYTTQKAAELEQNQSATQQKVRQQFAQQTKVASLARMVMLVAFFLLEPIRIGIDSM